MTATVQPEDSAEPDFGAEKLESPVTDTEWLEVEPVGAGWVRRARRRTHRCQPPEREVFYPAPGDAGRSGIGHREQRPDGEPGDLWRCSCRRLWEIYTAGGPRGGMYVIEHPEWRLAGVWTRLTWWLR